MNQSHPFSKYYKKTVPERIKAFKDAGVLQDAISVDLAPDVANSMIENQIATYQLPYGVAPHFLIDGEEFVVPMVIEEPSVIAAASSSAKLFKEFGGFQTAVTDRIMIGQAILTNVPDIKKAIQTIEENETTLIQTAHEAHPSIVRRGGGVDSIRVREVAADAEIASPDFLIVHLNINTLEAMGANMTNTMMEAVLPLLEDYSGGEALMGILSNYATECLATATCRIPASALAKGNMTGEDVRDRLILASQVAYVDPYRAVTHNKGIMNGIDAVVVASGNDWRAISAGIHAYAARSGQYRSLSRWQKAENGDLLGELTVPLPVGAVGGSISFHPGAKLTHHLLGSPNAEKLEAIIASVGLAQNFSAMRALVTDGIQKGHMGLQSRSLAITAGAKDEEIEYVSKQLNKSKQMNLTTAKDILAQLRNE